MAKLPQFSRNYGSRGGAYERPTTVVDTPSSNPWAKAIETTDRDWETLPYFFIL